LETVPAFGAGGKGFTFTMIEAGLETQLLMVCVTLIVYCPAANAVIVVVAEADETNPACADEAVHEYTAPGLLVTLMVTGKDKHTGLGAAEIPEGTAGVDGSVSTIGPLNGPD
jgi:hypothetical protein